MDKNYEAFYGTITNWFRQKPSRVKTLKIANRLDTALFYVAYPVLLITLFFTRPTEWLRFFYIPAGCFIALSLIRKAINRKRPYEAYAIDPLIFKDKQGESMPSRHIFSSSLIAMAVMRVCMPLGIVLLILSACGGYMRMVGGIHYPSDIVVGFLCGILSGGFLFL